MQEILHLTSVIFNHTLEGIMVTDSSGKILWVNPAFSDVTGYSAEEVIGQTPRILNSGRHSQQFYETMWHSIGQTGKWQGEIWNRRKNGEVYCEWLTIVRVSDQEGNILFYIGIFMDITRRKNFEDRLKQHAYYDFLTGIPNRILFREHMKVMLNNAKRNRQELAVLFIDLDKFKSVNDLFGHDAGDRLLQHVTQLLKQSVPSGDTVYRIGGDEFIVVLPSLNLAQDVITVARKIIRKLTKPFIFVEHEIFITPSIGISLYPNDGDDTEILVKKADSAMYKAKQNGGNSYQFYSSLQNTFLIERIEFENQLYQAIKSDQLVLHYQPQYDLKTGTLIGLEALIRWQHPQRGLLFPGDFIPFAEDTGLIVPIGEWVLRKACQQKREWRERMGIPLRVAVNISAQQFQQGNLAELVEKVMRKTGIEPKELELELTESTVMKDAGEAVKVLKELKSLGVHLSIDDFGTGYSSLSYLSQFPVDTLKIDRTFINSFVQTNETIVAAIIKLAHSLQLKVVAEGIENQQQLDRLKQHGCDRGQGYLFGKPHPLEQWMEHMEQWMNR